MSSSVCGLSSTTSIFGGLCSGNNRRPSIFHAKFRLREERKKVLKMSLAKVKRIEDPESFLRRSVLINNTIKRLQREVREEKMMRHGGYTPRLSSCSSYRKSFACSRLSELSVVDEPVLDDEPGLMEPEGPSPLDSITIDKSHHNSPSIMHNPRKRPLSDESEDDCDVQAVLSQIYIPPTPCIISSIDDDENAMHAGPSSSTSGNQSSINLDSSESPCDSSSILDSVTFSSCSSSLNGSSSLSLDCPLPTVSSMLISQKPSYSSQDSDYLNPPERKRARLTDDPTSLLAAVSDDCALDEDDVDVDVVGDSEMSEWPTPSTTPTSLSLLTSSSQGMNTLAASLALSYSISATLAGSGMAHHPMSMSSISAAAAAVMQHANSSSCLLSSSNLQDQADHNRGEIDNDVGNQTNQHSDILGAIDDDARDSSSGNSNSSDSNDITFPTDILSTTQNSNWGNDSSHNQFSISSSSFPIFSSSFANTNHTVLSPSTMGNGLMMSPLPLSNPCSIPSFVEPSIVLPTGGEETEDDDEHEEDLEKSSETKENSDQIEAKLINSDSESTTDDVLSSLASLTDQIDADKEINPSPQFCFESLPTLDDCREDVGVLEASHQLQTQPSDTNDLITNESNLSDNFASVNNTVNNSNDPSSPSSSSSSPSSPPEEDKQAQQQYSSCGHSSIFGELQSVVFHNLIASLES